MVFNFLLALATITSITFSAPSHQGSNTVPGVFWKVEDLSRSCTPSTIPTPSCSYQFIISATNEQPDFTCLLIDYGSPNSAQNSTLTDPRWNSFSAYPCNGDEAQSGGWEISWGYDSEGNSAVMTVVNESLNQDAWFGWDDVNNRTQFDDDGPNPVYTLGTFT